MIGSRRHRLSFAIVLLAVVAALSVTAEAQWFRRFANAFRPMPAPPANAADKTENADESDDGDGTRSVVFPDNGDVRRKLDLVRKQIEGEHHADAARQLAQFLQDPEIRDFFLSRDDERRGGSSFQAEVRRLLRELTPEGLAAYRVQYEPVARMRLNAAMMRGDEAALREVAMRFPETKAGDEALYRLGHFLWDHGRPRAAVGCLVRLQARPEAAAPFEPALSALVVACWGRLGDRDRARAAVAHLHETLPEAAVRISGVSSPSLLDDKALDEFLNRLGPGKSPSGAGAGDWSTFRGDPARNRAVAARPPFLAPRWSLPASADPRTQLVLDRVAAAYAQGSGTSLPLLSPLAVGDLLLVRTPRGVAAYDVETGCCRWRHPSDDDGTNIGLDRGLWQEPAGGAFSADEECVYLVGDARPVDRDAPARSRNLLSAREHFRSREGKLRWQVGGGDGGDEPRLAGAFFLGPPLTWHERLYVLAETKGALTLVVLDRAKGRLEWSQELALVEQEIAADLPRMLGGATPSISADEIIICPTSGGAVVAVDLTTQSLLWAYRYARKTQGQPAASEDELAAAPRLDQFDRWLDATAAIAGESVILTPPESREIHCLDLKSGEARWTQPRGEGMFVGCVTGEALVVVGRRQVLALRLTDGAPAWIRALPDKAFPSGRGVFAGERYFLPLTSAAVLEIDLATGALAGEYKSPRELSSGNLIWHKGLFFSQGPSALEAFDERDSLLTQVRERLERNPRDVESLVRHGDLELASGRLAEAIAAFRTAHEADHSPRTKSKLVSALLQGVHQNLPEKESLSIELDGLIGP